VSNRRIVLPGAVLGVVVLALFVVFAVLLPKANGEGDLSLPDTLPGGYTATDLTKAYRDAPGATADKVAEAAATERSARTYGDKVLAASGVEAVTRSYVTKDLATPLVVQAFRARGGAFAPFQFADPAASQQGQSVERLVKKGDAVCIERGAADGNGGVQASYVECQKSEGELTVQVTSPLSLAKTVDLVDDVFEKID
jgi:hypothetical protein